MSTRCLTLVICALSVSLGAMLLGAAPVDAQTSRLSPVTITRELELGVVELRKALDSQTTGTPLSPAETAKGIYNGYARIRAAHALLTRRMIHVSEKTKSPDPVLQLAFTTIKGARYKVLHAREAAAKEHTVRSVELLSAAIPELERAIALIQ